MGKPLKHPGEKSIGWALQQTTRLYRTRMGERLAEHGLFAGQELVMQALSAGPRTMGELSRILRVRPPTVTKTVARLALLGFVVRKVQKDEEEDGRIVWAKLTRKGVKKVEIIKDILEEIEVDILSSLDTKERRRLKKYLNKVSGSLAISSETEAALADEPETFAAGEEPLATSRLSNAVHPLPDADTTYIALKPET